MRIEVHSIARALNSGLFFIIFAEIIPKDNESYDSFHRTEV